MAKFARHLLRRVAWKTVIPVALAIAAPLASADQWRVTPGVSGRITYTDNVNLSSSGQGTSSVVASVTPRIAFTGQGRRYSVSGLYALTGNFYTNGQDSSTFYSNLNLFGNVEAVERFFYIDGGVNILQNFFSPFGPITIDNSLQTNNRYTTYVYRLNPYIQGHVGANTSYLLRWNNTWTDYSQSALRESYISNLIGQIGQSSVGGSRFGWGLDYLGSYVKYNNQQPYNLNLGRLVLSDQLTPELQVSARGGYEYNDYSIQKYYGAIYGAGLDWRPTPRTDVNGYWEHRFFGDSYAFNFSHRTRMTGWRLTGSRNITTSQQALNLGTGLAAEVVDAAFQNRIPDAAQRQEAVQQFLAQTGLPSTLTSPISYYTEQILLQQGGEAAFSLLGVRNSIVFTLYWNEREPITGAGVAIPPLLAANQNNIQQGASVNYTHQFSANSNLSLLALRNYTKVRNTPNPDWSSYTIFRALLTSRLSPRTTWFAGASYQWQDPSNSTFASYNVFSVYAGIDYAYR